jgi:SAM-dependent MidA family methyltransferase
MDRPRAPRGASHAPRSLESIEVGVRRETLPNPAAVGEDAELAAAIRGEITTGGPIPFARFMERALYEPGHGYYRRDRPGPGAAGDFLTAPEAHPIFGAAIGQLLEQAWTAMGLPGAFVVSEPGAGTGALAEGLLAGLRDLRSPLAEVIRYRPVEIEARRLEALTARLESAELGRYLVAEGPGPDAAETGAIVANEVLDALPVHRVIGRAGGVHELLVGVDRDGRFIQVEAEPTTPALASRLAAEGITLEDGQTSEVCLALVDWLIGATRHLAAGIVVLVDYAMEPAVLHAPERRNGTLRAFAGQAVGADPYRHVGRQDLTATVDLAAVRSAAASAGLDPVGETTQAELLASVGTGGLTTSFLRRPGASLEDALRLRSALARLLDPRAMGGFRVLAFGRSLPPGTQLAGLRRLAQPG